MTKTLIEIAIQAALDAGNEILKIYNSSDFGIELKSDNSPLTLADKAAHKSIVSHLLQTNYPILSEEGKSIEYEQRKKWTTYWLIDPLDGTKEFIKKNGEFTVNIALIDKQIPVMGVVFVPVSGTLYFAYKGEAYKSTQTNNINLAFDTAQKLPLKTSNNKYIVVGSRSHMSDQTRDYIDRLDTQGKELEMISKGSSLKICLVAEGSADCYPRMGPTMEWDTAAGHAIALGAQKKVLVYPQNNPMLYNKENLLNPYFVVS